MTAVQRANERIEAVRELQGVLDACRENPFARDFRVEHKGLSQIDAPPGTLLAYATSPGSATEGIDYTGVSGTVIFPPGVTNQSVSVPLMDDPDVKKAWASWTT